MPKKVISVIVTTYNSEKHIKRTLDSIVNQQGIKDQFDTELIIVDDCSTDNTIDIIKNYSSILLQTQTNSGGPNKGRNLGLQKATGDYICIVDHDDEWKEDRIVSLLPYLEKSPIVSSGYTLIDESKTTTIERVNTSKNKFIFFERNTTFLARLTKSLIGQNVYLGSLIYSKDLKNILFEEKFGAVDFDWILRLFHQQSSIEVCKSLYNRYVFGSNLSLNENFRQKDFNYSLQFIENYRSQYPKETKIAYKKIHGSRARYYYLTGNMKLARKYFLKSQWNLKTLAYFLTSFYGAKYVKKKFNVFG